jgi:hypothetical protein
MMNDWPVIVLNFAGPGVLENFSGTITAPAPAGAARIFF